MAAGSVTLVFDGSFAAAHALIDRCCDARWLAASRRAKLRAEAARRSPTRAACSTSGCRSSRSSRATPDAGREPAQRHGAALRLTIRGDRAEAAVVRDLAGWGTGELLASAFVIEHGVDAPSIAPATW